MSEPRVPVTEAGRRHVEEYTVALVARPNGGGLTWNENAERANATVLAIEAAARADALAEVRDRVRRMPTVKVPRADFEWSGETVRVVEIAAVLALLDPPK